jgi:hypothetical protein
MLQLSKRLRGDLMARKVPSKVWYNLIAAGVDDDKKVKKQFEYMARQCTERLTLSSRYSFRATSLQHLRELYIREKFIEPTRVYSLSYPTSMETLNIHTERPSKLELVLNLDTVPNLKSVKLTQDEGSCINADIRATQTPQNLSSLELLVHSVTIDRACAARIMRAPKFTNFNVYEVQGMGRFNQAFDGLSAPNLEKFSSTGSPRYPHDYDLDAPQLQRIDHYNYGCLPKSATKYAHLTYLNTEHHDPNQYAHLSRVTEMTVMDSHCRLGRLPENLKKLKIIDWRYCKVEIEKLPDHLEVLDTSNIFYDRINLMCELPKTLHTWMVPDNGPNPVPNMPEEWKNIPGRSVCEYNVVRWDPRYTQTRSWFKFDLTYTIKTRTLNAQ